MTQQFHFCIYTHQNKCVSPQKKMCKNSQCIIKSHKPSKHPQQYNGQINYNKFI